MRHALSTIDKFRHHLSVNQEVVLRLSAQGKTYPEIAEILGVTVKVVKSRLHHAKEKLDRLIVKLAKQRQREARRNAVIG